MPPVSPPSAEPTALCEARVAGPSNSFVVAGHGGLPVDPDGYLPNFPADILTSSKSSVADDGKRHSQATTAYDGVGSSGIAIANLECTKRGLEPDRSTAPSPVASRPSALSVAVARRSIEDAR